MDHNQDYLADKIKDNLNQLESCLAGKLRTSEELQGPLHYITECRNLLEILIRLIEESEG